MMMHCIRRDNEIAVPDSPRVIPQLRSQIHLRSRGGLWKLSGQRPGLPGKEILFLLCSLDSAYL